MFDKIKSEIKTKLEKPSSARLLTVGAAVLLVGGGIAAYWAVFQKTPLGQTPTGSEIVPQNAWIALSLTTDTGQWQQLRELGTPESRAVLDKQLLEWQNQLFTGNGYNYEKDIQPWVGREVMLAWLPPQGKSGSGAGQTQPLLAVLPVANQGRAKEWFEKPPTQQQWTDRTYKDVKIRENQNGPDSKLSTAILDNRFALVSNDPKAVELAIDTYKGGASLAKIPGYTEALGRIETPNAFARVFVNVPAAAAVAAMNSVRPLPPETLKKLQLQGVASQIALDGQGVRFKGVSWLKPNVEKKMVVENNAKGMVGRLPADSLMVISGSNLQRFWQEYAAGADANPLAPMSPQWLQSAISSSTGLNLEKDLLSWMAGEFSLSLIPAPVGSSSQFPTSIVLMVRSNDRRAGEQAFKQLDGVMSSKYKFKVESSKINNEPVVNWTSQYGAITLNHGWLNGNVAFLLLGAPVAASFTPKPQSPLPASDLFQKAVPSQLEAVNGQFFLNVDGLLSNKKYFFPELPPVQKTMAGAIGTIGLTTSTINDHSTRFDIYVSLKRNSTPTPSPTPSKSATPSPTTPQQKAKPSASPSPQSTSKP